MLDAPQVSPVANGDDDLDEDDFAWDEDEQEQLPGKDLDELAEDDDDLLDDEDDDEEL